MMRAFVCFIALLVSGCDGCDPTPIADEPARWLEAEIDAGAPIEPLAPEALEGILPPRWQIGDEWFFRMTYADRDELRRPVPKSVDFGFKVTVVTSAENLYRYEVDFRALDPEYLPWGNTLVFYNDLFHLSRSCEGRAKDNCLDLRSWGIIGWTPSLAFPIAPPLLDVVPPRFENPYPLSSWMIGDSGYEGVQAIEPTPDGVRITLWMTTGESASLAILEWRRGDPWWSSAACWVKTISNREEPPPHQTRRTCFGELYHPGETLAPPTLEDGPAPDVPDKLPQWSPRKHWPP